MPEFLIKFLSIESVAPLFFQVCVEVGDFLFVSVEEEGIAAFIGADDTLAGLAPSWMRDGWIDIGPESVFAGLDIFPEAEGLFFGEFE